MAKRKHTSSRPKPKHKKHQKSQHEKRKRLARRNRDPQVAATMATWAYSPAITTPNVAKRRAIMAGNDHVCKETAA